MAKLNEIRLIDDQVMILQDRAQEKSDGGILLANAAQEQPQKGTVILVGPGKRVIRAFGIRRVKLTIKVDDKILFRKYSGLTFEFEKEMYLIMTEKDIILILPK